MAAVYGRSLAYVLWSRQQRLLVRVGPEGDGIQTLGCSAATAKTSHRLHELIVRHIRERARYGRRVNGQAAKLPIQADRAQRGGSGQLIVSDVVDLECAGILVAQHQIGF